MLSPTSTHSWGSTGAVQTEVTVERTSVTLDGTKGLIDTST